MSSDSSQEISSRERRARQKAKPELNRDFRDILIGRGYGKRLEEHLCEHDITGIRFEESACDILCLAGEPDFDRVEKLIDDCVNGKGFTATDA